MQHHPARAARIEPLLERLAGLDVQVVTDPDPDGRPSPWRCYLECLRQMPAEASHLCVIQDDAIPAIGFAVALERVVAAKPDKALCLWVGGSPQDLCVAMLQASKAGVRFVDFHPYSWVPAVCVVWPAVMVRQILMWAKKEGLDDPANRSDDALLARFCQKHRVWPVATVPSLVQHPDIELSLIGRRAWAGKQPSRVACIAPPLDLSAIEW